MKASTCNKIRITQLRNARNRYLRNARSIKERIARGDLYTHELNRLRLQLVIAVTKARCNNHSILMWKRIYK